jgi:hypothetical protein
MHPTTSSAAAHAAAIPSLELLEARRRRDALKVLLREEQAAMAAFLVELADFDARRGWEPLGHASRFAFLHVELRLPNPSAFWRMSAARLLQRFPDLVEPLRDGRLCCTVTAELAKVLTEENRAAVLPRFIGLSSREAQELVAELQPRQAPATRTVVTSPAQPTVPRSLESARPLPSRAAPVTLAPALVGAPALSLAPGPRVIPQMQLRAPEVEFGGVTRSVAPSDAVEPLSADRRRLHVNVSRQLVAKLDAARAGLAHAIPGASMEQVLEAALDLLLEKQARARGQVKRPRAVVTPAVAPASTPPSAPAPGANTGADSSADAGVTDTEPYTAAPLHRRTEPREVIPAAVKRAVWVRDAGRCCWPLDGGGTCGSTHRLELDHIRPWAQEGDSTEENLRVVCAAHNRQAARQAFGRRCAERYSGARDIGRLRGGPAVGAPAGSRSKT